jgi:phospholipid transport system substrate-binding protein
MIMTGFRSLFSVLFMALAILVSSGARAGAPTGNPEQARAFITDLSEQATAILKDPTIDEAQRQQQVSDLIREGMWMKYVSRFVLGRFWRAASKPQRREFASVFEAFILSELSKRLVGYTDQHIKVGKATLAGKRDILVDSTVVDGDGPPIALQWRVRLVKGKYKVIDLAVENISMAIEKRAEFSALAEQSGVDGLIETLKTKVAQNNAQSRQLPTPPANPENS